MTDQFLKKLKFFIAKMKKKNFRFEKKLSIRITMYIFWLISSSWTQIYLSWSKKICFSPCKSRYQNMPLPQTSQIWGKNLRCLHVFGNGHELFDAFKDQSCVAWWRQWYFWTQHYLRTSHMCYFTHVQQYSKNSSFFFFIFAMINFDFFKSGSIKNTATNA